MIILAVIRAIYCIIIYNQMYNNGQLMEYKIDKKALLEIMEQCIST
jgi:hypothetical protein